jgi:hypothetical protein
MMPRFFCLMLAPLLMHAAVIRGSLVEHASGKPLARAMVKVMPIPPTPGTAVSGRTSRLGGFEFHGLAGGAYMVTVARPGFAEAEYGQKEWNSAGYPIFIEPPAAAFLQMRLRRLGAISGTVLDEEDIGLPDHEVAVYRNTRPPELIGRVKTDDRGVYRMGGLMQGSYLVRTVGKHYEEGDYVPTFHRESREIADAQSVDVMLDEQVDKVDLRPHAGKLVTIEGSVALGSDRVVITVVSDTGRQEQRGSRFRFDHMPPGRYEIYAQDEGSAGYADLAATKEINTVSLQLAELSVGFREDSNRMSSTQI